MSGRAKKDADARGLPDTLRFMSVDMMMKVNRLYLPDEELGLIDRLTTIIWTAPRQRLPNDDAWLAKRLGKTVEHIEAFVRPVIKEHFTSDGNWITSREVARAKVRADRKRAQASDAANARWDKEKEASGRNAKRALLSEGEGEGEGEGEKNPPVAPHSDASARPPRRSGRRSGREAMGEALRRFAEKGSNNAKPVQAEIEGFDDQPASLGGRRPKPSGY